jgi:hypothetical protein
MKKEILLKCDIGYKDYHKVIYGTWKGKKDIMESNRSCKNCTKFLTCCPWRNIMLSRQ